MLVPSGWQARETAGLAGPLPYLSDRTMSIIIYLIGRQPGTGAEASLQTVVALAGAAGSVAVLHEVDVEQDTGAAVWDQVTGGVHHALAGYVRGGYVGMLATTSAFCPQGTAYTAAEAQAFADFLEAVALSYHEPPPLPGN